MIDAKTAREASITAQQTKMPGFLRQLGEEIQDRAIEGFTFYEVDMDRFKPFVWDIEKELKNQGYKITRPVTKDVTRISWCDQRKNRATSNRGNRGIRAYTNAFKYYIRWIE